MCIICKCNEILGLPVVREISFGKRNDFNEYQRPAAEHKLYVYSFPIFECTQLQYSSKIAICIHLLHIEHNIEWKPHENMFT